MRRLPAKPEGPFFRGDEQPPQRIGPLRQRDRYDHAAAILRVCAARSRLRVMPAGGPRRPNTRDRPSRGDAYK